MSHKIGIPIKGVRLKDGRLETDHKAQLAKLPVNKRIAQTKSKRIRVIPGHRTPS